MTLYVFTEYYVNRSLFRYISASLKEYLQYVKSLEYDSEPDYEKLKGLLRNGLKKTGKTDDGVSVILPGSPVSIKTKLMKQKLFLFDFLSIIAWQTSFR